MVAEHQIKQITGGRLQVEELSPEAAMALTFYGIYGLAEFPFDEAHNLSRSLNIALENKGAGYEANGRSIGVNTATRGGRDWLAVHEVQFCFLSHGLPVSCRCAEL